MKYKTLYDITNAYELDQLDEKLNPIVICSDSAFVYKDGMLLWSMDLRDLIEEMAYLTKLPIKIIR